LNANKKGRRHQSLEGERHKKQSGIHETINNETFAERGKRKNQVENGGLGKIRMART